MTDPDAELVDVGVDDMKRVLTAGCPVQLSLSLGEEFADVGRDGIVKVTEAPSGDTHAMLCVGYVGNYFILESSWGEGWGDKGYCYVPKKMLLESSPEPVALVTRRPPAPFVAKFCVACGAERRDEARFCHECGALL